MSIGERILEFLIEKGISQTWLSKETKISNPKLNASLHNKRKLDVEEFATIISALNVDANTFINNRKLTHQYQGEQNKI